MALFCSKIKIEEELYISHAYKIIILLYFPNQLQCKVLSGMVFIEILNAYITQQNFEQQSEDKRKQYTGRISDDKQNPELKKSFITTSSAANSSLVLQKKKKKHNHFSRG